MVKNGINSSFVGPRGRSLVHTKPKQTLILPKGHLLFFCISFPSKAQKECVRERGGGGRYFDIYMSINKHLVHTNIIKPKKVA